MFLPDAFALRFVTGGILRAGKLCLLFCLRETLVEVGKLQCSNHSGDGFRYVHPDGCAAFSVRKTNIS